MQPNTTTHQDDRRDAWNQRYSQTDLVWSAGPNRFLADEVRDLPPGRALDLGAGEGRNAIWLAEHGWNVTAVDFSDVAIAKASAIAASRNISLLWEVRDLLDYHPEKAAFDLVMLLYIHLPEHERSPVLASAAAALAPGGTLLVIGHDIDNIAHGVGGPQDPSVLYSASDVVRDIEGLQITRATQLLRPVRTDGGEQNAIDVLVRAVRPPE
jgi:SAM-dependent methyltransferase